MRIGSFVAIAIWGIAGGLCCAGLLSIASVPALLFFPLAATLSAIGAVVCYFDCKGNNP